MLTRRTIFPAVYIVFLLPLLTSSGVLKAAVLILCPVLALAISLGKVRGMFFVLATAFATLLPLLILVQAVVCSSLEHVAPDAFASCVAKRSLTVLLNVCLLSSLSLMAVANEWRRSLPETINRMGLPRGVRVITIISGAMIGGFRRSLYKVHHAFTSRGDALPSFHWKNAAALPTMLGIAWASELNGAINRIKGQWSSDAFWQRYIPDRRAAKDMKYSATDLVVLVAAAILVVAVLSHLFGGSAFYF